MRLGCPNCGALYEVDDSAIPESGREVQCSACDHRWHVAATGDAPDAPRASDPPRPRAPDPAVLKSLREEAARELSARRRETAGAAGTAPGDAGSQDGAGAGAAAPPRRALLPEIDEISPTLHPDRAAAGAGSSVRHAPDAPRQRGFATGLAVSLTLSALAAAAYVWSSDLAAAVPVLGEPLESYVDAVDRLRLAIRSAAG